MQSEKAYLKVKFLNISNFDLKMEMQAPSNQNNILRNQVLKCCVWEILLLQFLNFCA